MINATTQLEALTASALDLDISLQVTAAHV